MDEHYALAMPDDHTQRELDDECWEQALAHAEMYGYYPSNAEDSEDDEYTSDAIEGHAELYDPAKHDGLRSGGGSFAEDFAI